MLHSETMRMTFVDKNSIFCSSAMIIIFLVLMSSVSVRVNGWEHDEDGRGPVVYRKEGENCTIKNGESGICRKLTSCGVYYEGLKQKAIEYNFLVRCIFIDKDEVICCPLEEKPSVSLSILEAVRNVENSTFLTEIIRNKLIGSGKNIKLLWIPGHVGIKGNETADKAAKSATSEPLSSFYIPNIKDTRREINHYWDVKLLDDWITYPTQCSGKKIKIYLRLRFGHTFTTHGHLMSKTDPPNCHLCNTNETITIKHLVYDCPKVKDELILTKVT